MSLKLGSTPVVNAKLGSTQVSKIYLGATEVWSSFDPISLSPALWLSDTGSDAATWPDISGNGRNATQATALNQPSIVTGALNGRQVRRFDGSNDYMSCGDVIDALTGAISLVVVAKISNTTAAIIGKSRLAGTTGRYTLIRKSGTLTGINSIASAAPAINATKTSDTSTAYRILSAVYTRGITSTSTIWINGTQEATASGTGNATSYNTTDQLMIGAYQSTTGGTPPFAGFYLNGDIAEAFVFQSALSSTDRESLEAYLKTKYAL